MILRALATAISVRLLQYRYVHARKSAFTFVEIVTHILSVKTQGEEKYISFVPDRGGWNNIRMSMEIIFVFAAATGRTLVLPPEQPLYLLKVSAYRVDGVNLLTIFTNLDMCDMTFCILQQDKGKKHRGFADFFPLHTAEFQKRVPVITMEEFVRREGGKNGRLPVPDKNRTTVQNAASYCVKMKKSELYETYISCFLHDVAYLTQSPFPHRRPVLRCHCRLFDVSIARTNRQSTRRMRRL